MAEEKKIDFYRECKDLVENEVYCDITQFVDYIVKSEAFWNEDDKCPLVYSDIEYKRWNNEEDDEEEDEEYDDEDDEFDYFCAYYVSDWLADKLYEHGEFVARYQYSPCIWFRRTFGQAICIDSVIDEITREILVYRGKCTEEEVKKLSIC